jgi:hypothetical protein
MGAAWLQAAAVFCVRTCCLLVIATGWNVRPRSGHSTCAILPGRPAQGRGQKRKGRSASGGVLSFDPRAGYLPWTELHPGDPDRCA